VSRISPEAPVPVVLVERETFLLGGASNVVNNIHSLGGQVSLCGVIGDDEMGLRIQRELTENGIDVHGLIVEEGRKTTTKTRIVAHQQQVVRIDREMGDPLKPSTLRRLSMFVDGNLRGFDGIILSDYGKGLLTRELIRKVIRRAGETRKFVMVDPKLNNFFLYRGATVVTPNTSEASAAAGSPITDLSSLKRVGKALLKKLRCHVLVITRGEEGMALFEPDEEPYLVPTVAKEVFDVTGAGDTVIGAMALAMAAGAGVREAARLANHAAGIVVGKVGTATVTREELVRAMEGNF
ncbi:MAG: D-glycero-beta-D-manno-heptose-7-phosphate kinase, partial [Deltaproteobacteria bacterium]